jgi:hypothetical protein
MGKSGLMAMLMKFASSPVGMASIVLITIILSSILVAVSLADDYYHFDSSSVLMMSLAEAICLFPAQYLLTNGIMALILEPLKVFIYSDAYFPVLSMIFALFSLMMPLIFTIVSYALIKILLAQKADFIKTLGAVASTIPVQGILLLFFLAYQLITSTMIDVLRLGEPKGLFQGPDWYLSIPLYVGIFSLLFLFITPILSTVASSFIFYKGIEKLYGSGGRRLTIIVSALAVCQIVLMYLVIYLTMVHCVPPFSPMTASGAGCEGW